MTGLSSNLSSAEEHFPDLHLHLGKEREEEKGNPFARLQGSRPITPRLWREGGRRLTQHGEEEKGEHSTNAIGRAKGERGEKRVAS